MIAIDTNILVYASRDDLTWHVEALASLASLAAGRQQWAIPWPCVHEFLATVTRPRYFDPPTPLPVALSTIEAWRQSPTLQFIGEGAGYWEVLTRLATNAKLIGPRIHDARVAAICISQGVTRLWTADRDFGLFPELKCENPLVT
jgi:hypothetical protein